MAAKPLVLKKQKAKRSSRAKIFSASAEVYVTELPFHLNENFTYGIPDELLPKVKIGAKVKIPFKDSEKIGYIGKIDHKEAHARPIIDIKENLGIPESHLNFLMSTAERYGTNLDSILKFVKAGPLSEVEPSSMRFRPRFQFSKDLVFEDLVEEIENSSGRTLVIAPTDRELAHIRREIGLHLDSEEKCIFGLRNAIMQHFADLENIFIFDEFSEHYRERKSPYWHTRDVAILRSRFEPIKLKFISALPSMELFQYSRRRIIDIPKPDFRSRKNQIAYLPNSYYETVKAGLRQGSVLVSVATKDLVLAIICKKCRGALKCECGGKLRFDSSHRLTCVICSNLISHWRCPICSSHEIVELRSGANKLRDQFRKIFPGTAIYLSTAEKPIEKLPKGSIVIATPGMEPKEKYSAIVFLDSEFRVNAPYLRAEEQTRIQIYSLLRFLEKNGILYVDLASNHPLIQSLLKRNPLNDMERELKEREHLGLPPIWNLTRISNGSIFQIAESLQKLLSRARIQFVNSDKSLLVRTKELDTVILMKELILAQKFLSLKQLNLLKIEREPLDI